MPTKKRRSPLRYRSPIKRTKALLVGRYAWAEWVRELEGKHGVYVIRDRQTRRVLYVGESHSGQLYDTLTRHFQRWSGPHAGTTYNRHRVEVAVRITDARSAYAQQVEEIQRLRPEDNTHHAQRADDEWTADDFADDV